MTRLNTVIIPKLQFQHTPLYFGLKDIARYWKVLQRSIVVWAPTGQSCFYRSPCRAVKPIGMSHIPPIPNPYNTREILLSYPSRIPPAPYHIAIVPDQSTTPTQCCLHVFQAKNVHCVILNSEHPHRNISPQHLNMNLLHNIIPQFLFLTYSSHFDSIHRPPPVNKLDNQSALAPLAHHPIVDWNRGFQPAPAHHHPVCICRGKEMDHSLVFHCSRLQTFWLPQKCISYLKKSIKKCVCQNHLSIILMQ